MSEKRRGLGRGLGALIPTSLDGARSTRERPVDVFFPDSNPDKAPRDTAVEGADGTHAVEGAVQGQDGAYLDTTAPTTPPAAPATDPRSGTVVANDGRRDGVPGDGEPGDSQQDGVPVNGATTQTSVFDTPEDDVEVTADQRPAGTVAPEAVGDGDDPRGTVTEPAGSSPVDEVPTLDDGLVPVPGAVFAELPLDEIRPNPRQPRTVFDEDALDELVGSIREIGVLQPVVVRRADDGYELIMGERRWRAAGAAGLDAIPAIIRETGDEDLLRDALLENLHRSQLNPLEEAAAYQQLLDDFGCTHDELATRLHRSRPQISNTLRLLKLPPLVQRRVAAGVLSAGHARALLGLADGAAIERLAQRIVAEGLSVRAVEEIVALGGEGPAAKRRAVPRAGVRNEALDALAGRLSDRFETRVKVALGKSRGRLTVEFASVQDLNRILSTLAPEDPGLFHG